MRSSLITEAVGTATRVRGADGTRVLRHAVSEFIRVLGSVPDEPAHSLSNADVHTIQLLGEDVIRVIEERVGDEAQFAEAQSLVSAVYEIRRLLEEANRWHGHYAGTRRI